MNSINQIKHDGAVKALLTQIENDATALGVLKPEHALRGTLIGRLCECATALRELEAEGARKEGGT
jgi:hypothetical protein